MDLIDKATMERRAALAVRSRLRRIDAALDRIEDGSFGLCAGCGRRIGLDRLEADPAATHCGICDGPGSFPR